MPTPHRVDTPERQRADKILRALDTQIEELQRQKNLAPRGRAARIARAIQDANTKLAELGQAEKQRLTDRAEHLHRQLFGNRNIDDARIASIRDARDRAANLDKDPEKVADMMTRADRDGDYILLKAYAEEVSRRARDPLAKEHGAWGSMFKHWASNQTGGSDAVDELQVITHELTDPGQRMVRDSAFRVRTLPNEVRGYGNLGALAAEADSIAELPPTAAEQKGTHLGQFMRDDIR